MCAMLSSAVLILSAVLLCWIPVAVGIRLANCTDRGWVDVVETDTDVPFLCDQLAASDNVQWRFYVPNSITIGECRPVGQGCDDVTPHRMTRPDDSTTVFYLAAASRAQGSYDVACGVTGSAGSESRCQLNIIHPGSVTSSDCRVDVMTSIDPWTVGGECQIKDAFSSRDFYNCTWSETSSLGGVSRAPDVQSNNQSSAPSGQTYNYTCRFQTALRQQSATYTYTTTVFPGGQTVTAGSLRIVVPSVPQPGCRDGYYQEGETLSCTCTLDTPGIPAASVLWLNSATSGPTLQRTVTSQDHNRQLTCQARWGSTVVQQTGYTMRVAFGPKTVTLSDPGAFDLHPVSPGQLTLTCSALTFNPGVTFTWRGGQCSGTTGSTCRFTPTRTSDGDVITCTATNNVTGEANSSNSHTLDIQFPPPDRPVISGYSGQALYEGTTTDVTCTVTGGNPPVSAVTLTCGGQGREVRGTSSTVSLTANRTMQGDNCTCSARWKNHNSDWYPLTAHVTIKVFHAVDSVALTLNSVQQILTVHEDQATNVVIRCSASGMPLPNLLLTDSQGREIARLKGGGDDGKESQSILKHVLPAVSCEDSDTFTCTAENGVGQSVSSAARLRVTCKMRVADGSVSSKENGFPALMVENGRGELSFQLLTMETPKTTSFLHFGSSPTGSGQPPRVGLLSVDCSDVNAVARSNCIITAIDVREDTDLGYYNASVTAGVENTEFTFLLLKAGTAKQNSKDDKFGFGAGVGVGASVAIFLALLGAAFWVCWRRHKSASAEHTSHASSRGLQSGANSGLELSTTAFASPYEHGPYEQLKADEIGIPSHYEDVSECKSAPSGNTKNRQSRGGDGGYEVPSMEPAAGKR